MLAKKFQVTQNNVTFHLKVTEDEHASPFDNLNDEDNLDHPSNRYNYNGIKDCLREIETGEYIIDPDYDIFYHIGDYQSDSYWYYGNLESMIIDHLKDNPESTVKQAMAAIKQQIESHVEYLQSYVDSSWSYLSLLVEKVTVTYTHYRDISGTTAVWSDEIKTDDVWYLIEWSHMDDFSNNDQIADILLDCIYNHNPNFGLNTDTLSDICHHIDYDSWL